MMEGAHDVSLTGSPSPHANKSLVEDEDLRKQMTGIFQLIDKNNSGFISIAQLEETIRDLISEGHSPDFVEFIQSFSAYMETINALGKEPVDVNKLDLEDFCRCTKNYMLWRRARQWKRQDSISLHLNQSQEMPQPNGRFKVSMPLMRVLQSKNLFPGITKHYTSYGDSHGTIGVDEFITAIPNTHERELRMLVCQLNVDRDGLDEFFDDVGGLDHVMISGAPEEQSFGDVSLSDPVSAPNGNDARSHQASTMVKVMSRELQKVNAELERKCDAFQTEIQFLTVSVSKLENEIQKKDKEIERLKKETKTVNTLQESEKEFKSQVTTLSNQLNKSNSVVEELRRQFNDEKDKNRMLSDTISAKDDEIRKLTFQVKLQSTLQEKVNALQLYMHELEQDLEKERDKVMHFKNFYVNTGPRVDRRDSDDLRSRIPLYVRQSSFSSSTPPLSVELLTHAHPSTHITPGYPVTKLSFSTPSPTSITSPVPNLGTPITPASNPHLLPSENSASKLVSPSGNPGTPTPLRHDVNPIPLNLNSTPPGSPSNKRAKASLSAPSSPAQRRTHTIPTPPPPPTPTNAPTPTSSKTAIAKMHYDRIPLAPLSPPTPESAHTSQLMEIPLDTLDPPIDTSAIELTPITNSTTTTTQHNNVFLPPQLQMESGEDPALTSLRTQLWQLSAQLATTERLLAESQSRLEMALASPRITEGAWGVLKYFCPTGIFCTTQD